MEKASKVAIVSILHYNPEREEAKLVYFKMGFTDLHTYLFHQHLRNSNLDAE